MVKNILFSFLYFFFVAVYITYPLIFHLTDFIPGLGDELLITWIMNWNIHSFLSDPLNIFNANIFYPHHNSLAFSDAFFTLSLIAFLPVIILKEPVVAYNFSLIFSFITLGFFTYLLTYYLSKNHFSGIISGTLVAFSTFTLTRIMHLQVISIQWVPLSLLFFLIFSKTGSFRYIILSCIFFILQTLNSFLPGYFLLFGFSFFLIYFYFRQKNYFINFISKKIIIIILFSGVILIPFTIPYFSVSKEFDYIRDIRDTIHFGNRPEYLFYSSDKTKLQPFLLNVVYANDKGPYKYDGYLGFAIFILITLSLLFRYVFKKFKNNYFNIFTFIGIFSFILSLGPVFQWGGKVIKSPFMIPLPYALFYYLIPGFKGFRNSARWEMLTVFAMSIAIGIFIAKIFNKKSIFFKATITVIICAAVILEFNAPMKFENVSKHSDFPKIYSYINTLPKDAVIAEFPIYNWDMLPYSRQELMREYFSTMHFRKMINGGSGFSPPPWQEKVRFLAREFPSKETIKELKKIGVKYIIVHGDEYNHLKKNNFSLKGKPIPGFEFIKHFLFSSKEVKQIKNFDSDVVYQMIN